MPDEENRTDTPVDEPASQTPGALWNELGALRAERGRVRRVLVLMRQTLNRFGRFDSNDYRRAVEALEKALSRTQQEIK